MYDKIHYKLKKKKKSHPEKKKKKKLSQKELYLWGLARWPTWAGSLLSTRYLGFSLISVPPTTIWSLAVALTAKLPQESFYSFCPKSVSHIMYSTLHCQKHFPEHFHLATSQSRVPMALTAAKPFSRPSAFTGFQPCTGHFSGHCAYTSAARRPASCSHRAYVPEGQDRHQANIKTISGNSVVVSHSAMSSSLLPHGL